MLCLRKQVLFLIPSPRSLRLPPRSLRLPPLAINSFLLINAPSFPLVKEVLFGTIAVPEVGEKRQGPGFPWGGSLFQKTPGCANVFVFDTIMPDSQANLFGIPRNIDHRQNRPSIQYSLRSVAHVCQDCKDLEDLPDAHRTAELS